MPITDTVVINAAGTGTRLGLNIPKSMVEVGGKSLIERQLGQLQDFENIVVVVGFKGRELTDQIWQLRRDVLIAVNHEYQHTGSAHSFVIGSRVAKSRVVSLDGDLLVETSDLYRFIHSTDNLVGISPKKSKLPVLVKIDDSIALDMNFDLDSHMEWTGLLSIEKNKAIQLGSAHIFEGLKYFLPMKTLPINCFEIDEPEDILEAEIWLKSLEMTHE